MDPLQGLPAVNSQFTVIKGTGPAAHNLETSLHRATLTASSKLHPIKEHIGAVSKVFNNAYVKNAVRMGGLSAGVQKTVYNKIIKEIHAKDATIINNTHKKELIKNIVKHFGQDHHKVPKALIQRRYAENEFVHPNAATSARDLLNQKSHSSFNRDDGNRPTGAVGSIGDLTGRSSHPSPPSPPTSSYHPPTRLVV